MKSSPKQLSFNSTPAFKDHTFRFEHGGDIRKGKRKLYRPFDPSKALHMTMRSTKARGNWSFLKSKNEKKIYNLIYLYADRFGVKIYRYANGGNHLHLLLKARSRKSFQRFLRTVSGMIPRVVTQAKKGNPIGKFWDAPAYSKLVNWGKQFKNTTNYVFKNSLEAFGILPPRSEARGHIKLNYQELFDG